MSAASVASDGVGVVSDLPSEPDSSEVGAEVSP